MADKQKKLSAFCVIVIVCLPNLFAETDTDTHYLYFVRKSSSYVVFCIFHIKNIYMHEQCRFLPVKAS